MIEHLSSMSKEEYIWLSAYMAAIRAGIPDEARKCADEAILNYRVAKETIKI